jgi:2-polyprenyl-6-methoxyphenol hydroxylase-like FAD-dependent oxidoreductase
MYEPRTAREIDMTLRERPVGRDARPPRIAIVGGGIGGMALALSLHDAGFDQVDVYESATAVKELGVGINVLPHATRELDELGLLDELGAIGVPTAELTFYSSRGQRIWSEPRGVAAGYRWPQLSIHRGRLLGVLHRAVVGRLGAQRVHTGHHLAGFERHDRTVRMDFVDRLSGEPRARVEADLLVGCDGIHSTVRRMLVPDEGPPKWNGITMWRGVTEAAPPLSGRTMIMAGTFNRLVVVYPISSRRETRSTASVNWVACLKNAPDQPMPVQDWQHTASPDAVLEQFRSFAFPFLDIPALARGAETVFQYPMVDRDPLRTWSFGRVTLLGDAAHPMYPVGSNGASQAVIDARVLARELAMRSTIEMAIAAYDVQRRPQTAEVVLANRRGGPERCLTLVEERAPEGFADIADVVSHEELEEIAGGYKRTAGFDPESLNIRPSLSIARRPGGAGPAARGSTSWT